MREERFFIKNIPVVVYGETSSECDLFVHGQSGCKEEGAAFAAIACPAGHQVLAMDLPEHGERRGEKDGFNPWTAVLEIQTVFAYMKSCWSRIGLRANSIGAHFSMLALGSEPLCKALFVSPIVDMERLIKNRMDWAGVSEEQLREQGEIATDFGQTLSWKYLTWERQHPIQMWECPTAILYAGQDAMTDRTTVKRFASAHAVTLTFMESGEHWFHTPEQLAVLQAWERENIERSVRGMVREICRDETFLAQKSEIATAADLSIADDLLETLAAHKDGCVGMAANMIGVSKRIIVFDNDGESMVMFNPEIVKKSGPYEAEEGCLSLLGTRKAKRWQSIKVCWQNRDFQQRRKTFTGFPAQIIQHEIDHCEGILI